MTPRERTQAVLARKVPDRLPREFRLTPPLEEVFRSRTGAADPEEHYGLDVRYVHFAPARELPDFSRYYPGGVPRLWSPPGWEVGEWGVGVTSGSYYHFIHIEHPMRGLRDVSEIEEYPFPDPTRPERFAHLSSRVEALHARGLFAIGFLEWTIFEIAWHLRGMEDLFRDMAFAPRFAERLLEKITEIRCFQARKLAEAGVDLLKIGDDVGTQRALLMSRGMYRRWLQPRHARVIRAAREARVARDAPVAGEPRAARETRTDLPVSYHSDGNCWDVIPDLIEAGVTVLNPVQPECLDLAALKREFGRDLVFLGGIGTQTTMPFETADGVYRTVQRTIDILGPTGYFPCPTHVLEPEVPWENVEAYLRAVEEYGFPGGPGG